MYVDPSLGVSWWRLQLVAWGFVQWECERCRVEEGKEGKSCEDEVEEEGETKERSDMDDLERELKAGLGVM